MKCIPCTLSAHFNLICRSRIRGIPDDSGHIRQKLHRDRHFQDWYKRQHFQYVTMRAVCSSRVGNIGSSRKNGRSHVHSHGLTPYSYGSRLVSPLVITARVRFKLIKTTIPYILSTSDTIFNNTLIMH